MLKRMWPPLRAILKNGFLAWVLVAKLSIPAMILTRLLIWFDLIPYVAAVFRPVMSLLGLPPEAALVWVSGMLANTYVAITVFLSLMPLMEPLSLSQVTILSSMCLIAHSFLIEGPICRAAGFSLWRVTVLRLLAAVAFGAIVHIISLVSGWGAGPSSVVDFLKFSGEAAPSWSVWLANSAQQILMILLIVEALMLALELFKRIGLAGLLTKIMGPPLRLVGVGEKAVMVTIIGCLLGLAYGGGLIVAESRSGRLEGRDIYAAVLLMALFHSLLEDTVVMGALGGSLWCLLGGRLIFALAVSGVINRLAAIPRWKPLLVGDKPDF